MEILFETQRLAFRPITDEDHDALARIISDPENEKHPADEEMVWRWIRWCKSSYEKDGFGLWAVLLKETGEMIGIGGISMQIIDDEWKPEVGYHLRKDYHHQGLGLEMAKGARDYGFSHLGFGELYSYMDEDNVASYKTAEANGMTYLHLYTTKAGAVCRVYRITREEWENYR